MCFCSCLGYILSPRGFALDNCVWVTRVLVIDRRSVESIGNGCVTFPSTLMHYFGPGPTPGNSLPFERQVETYCTRCIQGDGRFQHLSWQFLFYLKLDVCL